MITSRRSSPVTPAKRGSRAARQAVPVLVETVRQLTITTQLSGAIDKETGIIAVDETDIYNNGIEAAVRRHHRSVLDTRKQLVRDQLKQLGWIEPGVPDQRPPRRAAK